MIEVDGEVFLSTTEVALRFGVSPRTVIRWHQDKPDEVGAVTGMNGRLYFQKARVDDTIRRVFRVASQPPPSNGTRRHSGKKQAVPA